MVAALRLEVTGVVETFELPEDSIRQRQVLRALLSGAVDGAVYHRRASGPRPRPGLTQPGPAAQRRRVGPWPAPGAAPLPYGLYGTAVVTGPTRPDGGYGALDEDPSQHVPAVSAAVARVRSLWLTTRPEERQKRA